MPPPAHGLAQRAPKWFGFLPPPFSASKLPRESGRPLAKLAFRPSGLPKPISAHLGTRFPLGRKPPNLPGALLFLGLFRAGRPCLHSTAHRGSTLSCITGLWVWAVVFAAGLGRGSSRKASWVLTV